MATLRLETGETIQIPNGSTPEQAQAFMEQAKALRSQGSQKPDTFLGESGLEGMGNLLSGLQNSGHTINPSDAWNVLKGMYQGQANETGQEESAALDQLKQGNVGGALSHFIAGTPLIGHPLVHGAHNLVTGNLSGAAGDLLSLFGPKAADMAAEGVENGARTAGLQMYRRNLPFTSASSPSDLRAAVEAGVDNALPAENVFSKGGKSLERIGSSKDPNSLLGNLEAQSQQYVTGNNGAQAIDPHIAFEPFINRVKGYLNSNSASVVRAGEGMLKEAEPGLSKLDPIVQKIFETDPHTGQPYLTPQQQIGLFEKWVGTNPRSITVATAHAAKRDAYDALNSNVFNDKTAGNATPAGARDANLMLSAGYKNAVNAVVPAMKGVNDQMHNLLTLKTALNEAAKQSPKEFNVLTNLAVGSLLGGSTHVMAGGGMAESAGAGLAGIIALQALKSPRVATQLGVILGKRFPQVADAVRPLVLPAAAAGSGAAQGLRSGNQQVQQLFNPASNH